MRLFFDHQAFEMQSFGGVSNSYAELIWHLRSLGADARLAIKESDNTHLIRKGIAPAVNPLGTANRRWFGGKKWFCGQRRLIRLGMSLAGYHNDFLSINQDYCVRQLKKQDFDVFEPTFFDSYFLPYLKGKPFVLTVHDMIPEVMGVDKSQAEQKKLLCTSASHIHVPSQNTKNDLVQILNIEPEKVTVLPHGAPKTPDAKHPSPYAFPYLLYVGARWLYKNFAPFLEECAIVVARHPEIHIVCTGMPFNKEEVRLIEDQGLIQHVVNTFANESELQALYQNAEAFVYPSAYEGFGLPVLEAFVNGCPVVLNNASCFPEIGGDAAIYFDVNHRGELADNLESLLTSGSLRSEMQNKGHKQASHYSWAEAAKGLLRIYEQLI